MPYSSRHCGAQAPTMRCLKGQSHEKRYFYFKAVP
jgi:hypothetical protein